MSVLAATRPEGPAPSLSYSQLSYIKLLRLEDDVPMMHTVLGAILESVLRKPARFECARIWKGVHLRTEMRREMTRRTSIHRPPSLVLLILLQIVVISQLFVVEF